jgi:two-component system sensor histidine kinase KdpD
MLRHARAGHFAVAALAGLGAIALVSGVVVLLHGWGVPVLSLGALYVFAVLPIAVVWGAWVAVPVGVLSMLTFNFFFLPPTGTLHLSDGENWLVLGLYLVVAIVTSDLAARARRRAAEAEQREREASVLTSISGTLLASGTSDAELDVAAAQLASVLGAGDAALVLGERAGEQRPLDVELPLTVDGSRVGTLWLDSPPLVPERIVSRMLGAVSSILNVAQERERLQQEALATETLRASDAIKTTILRTVSHDLRSPLTAIRAAADGLASSSIEIGVDDRDALVKTIVAESQRLDRLVADLLDLSRLEAGAVRPVTALWPVEELVSSAIDAADAWELTALEIPDSIPAIRVDAAQVDRALANVLENARRHARSRVTVAATCENDDVVLRISNDGPPIALGDAERIFEPFEHGTSLAGGSGLGLAIARGFVVANGGTLGVEHRAQGACFTFRFKTLPASRAARASQVAPAAQASQTTRATQASPSTPASRPSEGDAW